MATKVEHREIRKAAIRKMIKDKKAVTAYLKGEMSKEELDDQGVKLTMPI